MADSMRVVQAAKVHRMWTAPVLALLVIQGIFFLHAGPAHGQESASNSPATGVPAITGTVQVG